MTYFLYRHFMKALGDDAVQDKVQLALVSTAVIQLLDVYEWLAKGEVTHWRRSASARRPPREIEYANEDNTEQLATFSVLTKWNKNKPRTGVCGVLPLRRGAVPTAGGTSRHPPRGQKEGTPAVSLLFDSYLSLAS